MTTASWDRGRAAHLYRRAGFGGSAAELDLAVSLGREGSVSRLVDYEKISSADLEAYLDLFGFDFTDFSDVPYDRFLDLRRWWFLRMQHTPRPLEEKMTLFWHNHFATSIDKVMFPQLMYGQNQIFRTLGMGRFGDLLLAVAQDPAMLIWLDGASSIKNHPNENFAREVMELFTIGLGHYSQSDVKEAARAFTGWTVDAEHDYRFVYDPGIHDDGAKTFLGNRGFFSGKAILAILAARPETAAFLTGKLARAFIGSDPSPALAQRLQDLYFGTGGEIRPIVREILLSDDFDRSAGQPDMIKSPVEIIVGARRSLGVWDDPANYVYWPELMGMALFRPPNVGGWKGGRTWINTAGYLVRVNIALSIVTQPSPWGDWFRWDFSRFFEDRNFSSADVLIDFLVDRFNLVAPSDVLRKALHGYLTPGGAPFSWTPATYDYFGRGALYLLMSSPEYQVQ